jgi:hypothetical protein
MARYTNGDLAGLLFSTGDEARNIARTLQDHIAEGTLAGNRQQGINQKAIW